ncbi:hypothetical protein [Aquimarina longa]|uniref:hypothetical protein n=1 Tax=Aquimarina longa TaxID=1080221 RepID=UPI000780DE37|nr:hypothetical protein [Aquimarina longa]
MNTKELSYLLQNPAILNKEQATALEKIILTFPYFQSVRALLLKSLKDQESFRYNQELKTTAAYTTDRSVLFDFITSDLFKKNVNSKEEKKHTSDIKVIDPEEIRALPRMDMDDAVRMKITEAEDVLDPYLFSTKKEDNTLKQSEIKKTKTPEEILKIDRPLDFNKKETHSFTEWMKLTSLTPVDRNIDQERTENNEGNLNKLLDKKDKFNLIDEFIANNPKIQPAAKNAPTRNIAKENPITEDELMTETLARVYLAQKNYKKAIQAYNILILKNPKKSGFFADQIRAIKKLQENK